MHSHLCFRFAIAFLGIQVILAAPEFGKRQDWCQETLASFNAIPDASIVAALSGYCQANVPASGSTRTVTATRTATNSTISTLTATSTITATNSTNVLTSWVTQWLGTPRVAKAKREPTPGGNQWHAAGPSPTSPPAVPSELVFVGGEENLRSLCSCLSMAPTTAPATVTVWITTIGEAPPAVVTIIATTTVANRTVVTRTTTNLGFEQSCRSPPAEGASVLLKDRADVTVYGEVEEFDTVFDTPSPDECCHACWLASAGKCLGFSYGNFDNRQELKGENILPESKCRLYRAKEESTCAAVSVWFPFANKFANQTNVWGNGPCRPNLP